AGLLVMEMLLCLLNKCQPHHVHLLPYRAGFVLLDPGLHGSSVGCQIDGFDGNLEGVALPRLPAFVCVAEWAVSHCGLATAGRDANAHCCSYARNRQRVVPLLRQTQERLKKFPTG